MSLILSIYYGQLFIGLVCGAGIALCLTFLKNNKPCKKKFN